MILDSAWRPRSHLVPKTFKPMLGETPRTHFSRSPASGMNSVDFEKLERDVSLTGRLSDRVEDRVGLFSHEEQAL